MARIHLLDRQTAELIAAGEVIERPSSVVKELIENSIDAGAASITVELKNGGVRYIRVTDDGEGIHREDVPKAFLRHATSKVKTPDDLYTIGTLGFRGEALASIAAVARVTLTTRTAEDTAGTSYVVSGGVPGILEDAGCPVGTTIVVEDLFYNIPARMKFLKRDITEGNAVAALMDRLALSHPEISFKLIKDGKRSLHTPGDGKLLSAVYAVYGDFGEGLTEVSHQAGTATVKGYITRPEAGRAGRTMEHFFINGRYVKSVTMMAALEDAYKDTIMVGKFPGCVLMLDIPWGMVDVNVHPAKLEVKLSDERMVYEAVLAACKSGLAALSQKTAARDVAVGSAQRKLNYMEITQRPDRGEQQRMSAREYRQMTELPGDTNKADAPAEAAVMRDSGSLAEAIYRGQAPVYQPPVYRPQEGAPRRLPLAEEPVKPYITEAEPEAPADPEIAVDIPPQAYKLVGEVFNTYILAQTEEDFLLVDKHAAHERIRYNQLLEAHGRGEIPRQLLLSSVRVALPKDRYDALVGHLSEADRAGFGIEDFGQGSVLVREVPAVLDLSDVEDTVAEMAEMLFLGKGTIDLDIYHELYHSIACKSAIKGGSYSTPEEQRQLLNMLREDPSVRHCPHGRPVMISMSRRELESMFGR